jgi:hypothetical protein
MNGKILAFDPVAPVGKEQPHLCRTLDGLVGKVVGFIDNAKPNFNFLVDDMAAVLVSKYGVADIVKHRKRGQVPVGDTVITQLVEKCDAIITGSGD